MDYWRIFLLSWIILSSYAEEDIQEGRSRYKLTVIILTMNRPHSLQRLLNSLDKTEFDEPEDYFDVEIHVDKSLGSLYKDCVKIAKNYTTSKMNSKGKSTPKIFKTNHGLRAAWFDAWYPKPDDEFSIFVEDDLELSPYWYIWLKKTWRHYGNRSDIAGIALQRQFNMFQKPAADVEINNEGMPFLYKLVATWGFSPHPKHWREFLDWFHSIDNEKFDPYVPGLITSDWLHMHTTMGKRHMTWEQWHIYYGERHGLYTLYHNLPRRTTLASNWREAGVHTRNSFNTKDYPTLDYCAIELQEFPEKLTKYGWDAWKEEMTPEEKEKAKAIRKKFDEDREILQRHS
ncbi:uncharacterized protein [Lepeophtheirus salmonis]|uniref:uncharacterized protein n=1 Tax=Lepeophtheirus salmonis TaxID=72036 RepID=UPI001AE9B08F|nr:uncharacterized protein LOC121123695 [Lepeophtheirus salmonis]